MSKYVTVKYYAENQFTKESCQATGDSAGYDVFAAETKTFLPKSVDILLLELRWAIPTGFYGKLFPRSGILKEHFVSIDNGVIEADFRGILQVLMINHIRKKFLLSVLVIELLRLFLWKNLIQTFIG